MNEPEPTRKTPSEEYSRLRSLIVPERSDLNLPEYVIALQQQMAELTQRVESLEKATTVNVKVLAKKLAEISERRNRPLG